MLKNTDTVVNAVRYAVKARGSWLTFVQDNDITRDQIADTARELATLAYPSDETVQTVNVDGKKVRTRFGNAVQAAGNGMRSVLDADETKSTHNLLTADGKKADLEAVVAAWHAAQK
jgi:hypothetical protein